MNLRKSFAVMAVAIGVAGTATIASAAVAEIEIRTAPPADRVEMVPPPREGYVYERGHYSWDGQRYTWADGRFIKNREGHVYTPYALEHRGEAWYYHPGHWDDNQK